ncbi:MAG: hypothetical protein CVU06_15265, partial [Bacteroidetes bacterium HGW-Bacteroidetes-22]
FLVIFLLSFQVKAQDFDLQNVTNFYEFITLNMDSTKFNNSEAGIYRSLERDYATWGPRLFPSGSIAHAAASIIGYAESYQPNSSIVNQWSSLGPSNTPDNSKVTTSTKNHAGVGQIHRLTLDPGYDGVLNKTLYAASSFGGLWKSTDDGEHWSGLNTDYQLPISSDLFAQLYPNHCQCLSNC